MYLNPGTGGDREVEGEGVERERDGKGGGEDKRRGGWRE